MANLKSLNLLRNNPEEARKILHQARQGDLDAQYATGLIYAEGRGFTQDDAKAFFWLTLALQRGDEDAQLLCNVVGAKMSQEDYLLALTYLRDYQSGKFPE